MDRSPFWSQLLRSLNFQPPLSLRNKHIHAVRDSEMHRSVRRGWATTSTLPRYSPIQSLALNFTRSWKRPVPADGVRVAHRAWCLGAASRRARQQLLFEPGRISVLSCCLNSQWVHFIQTLGWSHSNQEDPASLCWAGKEEAGPGRVKKKGGWKVESRWQLVGSSLIQTHTSWCLDLPNAVSFIRLNRLADIEITHFLEMHTFFVVSLLSAIFFPTNVRLASFQTTTHIRPRHSQGVWLPTDGTLRSFLLFEVGPLFFVLSRIKCFAWRPSNNAMLADQNKEKKMPR